MKNFCALTVVFVLAILPYAAHAEQIPDYVLQRDYETCMGGENPQQDIQRSQYCSCVRNGMRSWDADAYASLLLEQAQTQEIAVPVQELAKICAEKVLR